MIGFVAAKDWPFLSFLYAIQDYVRDAANDQHHQVNYLQFARDWNTTADGSDRFYVTAEILAGYGKSWGKSNNIAASQEIMAAELKATARTQTAFQAENSQFPVFLQGHPTAPQPQQGVRESFNSLAGSSISDLPAISHPIPIRPPASPPRQNVQIDRADAMIDNNVHAFDLQTNDQNLPYETEVQENPGPGPQTLKRRREVVASGKRK
ncbi:hypothetical protein SISSUDRAFT_1038282, partial [Sistotremastrum suecicum HHB10207 ss-3]